VPFFRVCLKSRDNDVPNLRMRCLGGEAHSADIPQHCPDAEDVAIAHPLAPGCVGDRANIQEPVSGFGIEPCLSMRWDGPNQQRRDYECAHNFHPTRAEPQCFPNVCFGWKAGMPHKAGGELRMNPAYILIRDDPRLRNFDSLVANYLADLRTIPKSVEGRFSQTRLRTSTQGARNNLYIGAIERNVQFAGQPDRRRRPMIHHVSIPAQDPSHVAKVLSELTGWKSRPFPGPIPGAIMIFAEDGHGTAI